MCSDSKPQHRPFSSLSIAELIDHVSDPAVHSGGGTVAALVGASAAGVALLVMRLSAGRRANCGARQLIETDIEICERLASELQAAADRDAALLADLMGAYAGRRDGREGLNRYQMALHAAAACPLDIAGLISELLEAIDRQLPFASRFVVSDLGAAAALAGGAGRAALVTARINVELLDPDGPAGHALPELRSRADTLSERISRLTKSILAGTEAAISVRAPGRGD